MSRIRTIQDRSVVLFAHTFGWETTRMHETFFGLRKRPFLAVPTLERYFPVSSQESAVQSCMRAIQRAEGPVAVIGGTGLGKSMVCLRVVDTFRRNYEVILLDSSQICSRRALLQSLLFQLKMPYRDLSEGELRLSLMDRMLSTHESPTDGFLLVVDEAQSLSAKLLEELRLITNMMRDGMPRVRLVLAGTMRLEEMLGLPQLESLNQRLACRSYLMPLTGPESASYLTHKIELCGAPIHSVFTDDAIRLIHRATDGVPRLLDQVADQALRIAAESRQRPVSASVVEAAWAQLQQLPLPWSDSSNSHSSSSAHTIEFGSLDEDHESEFTESSHTAFDSLKPNYFELNEQATAPDMTTVRLYPTKSNHIGPDSSQLDSMCLARLSKPKASTICPISTSHPPFLRLDEGLVVSPRLSLNRRLPTTRMHRQTKCQPSRLWTRRCMTNGSCNPILPNQAHLSQQPLLNHRFRQRTRELFSGMALTKKCRCRRKRLTYRLELAQPNQPPNIDQSTRSLVRTRLVSSLRRFQPPANHCCRLKTSPMKRLNRSWIAGPVKLPQPSLKCWMISRPPIWKPSRSIQANRSHPSQAGNRYRLLHPTDRTYRENRLLNPNRSMDAFPVLDEGRSCRSLECKPNRNQNY